ncbi:MAG: ATP-binding protein [Polyangiaceae bacterium]|nr:ATP-binding protein [Polyangiaceae bacterium]
MTPSGNVDVEAQEPIAVSSVPISRETTIVSASATQLEAVWLDRLIEIVCKIPVEAGECAVVANVVRVVGEIFPDFGVGVCLVSIALRSSLSPERAVQTRGERRIFKYVPEGEEHKGTGGDSKRLFPGFAFERVIAVDAQGSTFHFASDDVRVMEDDSPMMRVVRRGVEVLGRGLDLARIQAKATAEARELCMLSSHMAQADKLASLGQIAAGVIHELNNPLTSIVAYTDWLIRKMGPDGDPDSLERLRRIAESSNRILRFTRDLVAYARPPGEVLVAVSLERVIEQALVFCEHVIDEHGVHVDSRFSEATAPVRGVPEQLVQVFVNLFTNACHAMPARGGVLTVSTELMASGAHVRVVVEDNGHGILPEHMPVIFAPFFTTKVDGRGTGLGLSIVKNIVDNHGAEIRAEPGQNNRGARFVLVFPSVARQVSRATLNQVQ